MSPSPVKPIFFATAARFGAWLAANHAKKNEQWVGFHKRDSGKPSMTWPESVEEVLCFGWIDGVRKRLDDTSYVIRFSPRKPTSIWSEVNIRLAQKLIESGRMRAAGLKAFEARIEARSGIYSYEQKEIAALDEGHERQFRANKKAWEFFQSQPPSYRRTVTWWVRSAKKEETRLKRLTTLIENSAAGRRLL